MTDYIIKLFLNAIAVFFTGLILQSGVQVDGFFYAVIVAALLSLLNVSLKPLLILLTLPATILSLGLFLFVVNTLVVLAADWLLGTGFEVKSFWWALLFSIILSIINSLFDRLTVKRDHRDDNVKVFDKDGKRIL